MFLLHCVHIQPWSDTGVNLLIPNCEWCVPVDKKVHNIIYRSIFIVKLWACGHKHFANHSRELLHFTMYFNHEYSIVRMGHTRIVMNGKYKWCNCNLFQDTILIFATGTDNNLKRAMLKELTPRLKLGTSRNKVNSANALCHYKR
jgi:hypothetical protein